MNKDEIPVLGGECVLCYYSSNLQCIVGISQPFKVSKLLLLYFACRSMLDGKSNELLATIYIYNNSVIRLLH